MSVSPEQFQEPGTGAIDYRIGSEGKAADEGWRRDTPPAGEDGTVPDRRFTLAHLITPNVPASGPGILPESPRPSTFDLPIG